MTAFLVLLFIGLLGLGTVNDIKANQAQEICLQRRIPNGVPQYSLPVVLAAGMGGIVACIASIMGNIMVTVIALAVTVLVTFPYLKKAIETVPLYGMLKTVNVNMEALTEQIELRQEYERLHK